MRKWLKNKKVIALWTAVGLLVVVIGIAVMHKYRMFNVANNACTHRDMHSELQNGADSRGETELSSSDKEIISEVSNGNVPYDNVVKACTVDSNDSRRIAVLVATVEYLNNKEVNNYKVPQVVVYKGGNPVPYINSNGDRVKMTLLNYGVRLTDKSNGGMQVVEFKDNKFIYNKDVEIHYATYITPIDIAGVVKSGSFKSYELVDKQGKVIGVVFIEDGINIQ
jgi:hypothetical protein